MCIETKEWNLFTGMWLFWFLLQFGFSEISLLENLDSPKNKEKTGEEHLLFTVTLLNRGVPDVETIYFVSTEQNKYNCLQKLPGVVVSKNDEVICSANK